VGQKERLSGVKNTFAEGDLQQMEVWNGYF